MDEMNKIMIVEDDPVIQQELADLLQRYGYEVDCLTDFNDPVAGILASQPQLVLLDLTLPQFDGFYIVQELRKESQLPLIVLTSRQTEIDELMSMQLGADDFITKPFNSQILLARIQAVLARSQSNLMNDEIVYQSLHYDLNRHIAQNGDQMVELTGNEHLILSLLLRERGRIIAREELMNHLWSNHSFVDDNTLTVNVNRVRKKLATIGISHLIETKRGEGYLIV